MPHRKLFIATAIVASATITACDSDRSSSPTAPSPAVLGSANAARSSSAQSRRGKVFRVTKECSLYTGRAGEICTITSSTLNAIEVGSRIVYASDANPTTGWLDTDVVLYPPGRGKHTGSGHCALSLVTGDGTCTLSGGTGKFQQFHATVVVSHLGGVNYAWEGTYSHGPERD
jgi:hypothetical protein